MNRGRPSSPSSTGANSQRHHAAHDSSLGYDRGIILLHDEAGQCRVTAASSGGEIELMKQFGGYQVPLSRTNNILVRTFNSGKPVLVEDAERHGLNQRNALPRPSPRPPSSSFPSSATGRSSG